MRFLSLFIVMIATGAINIATIIITFVMALKIGKVWRRNSLDMLGYTLIGCLLLNAQQTVLFYYRFYSIAVFYIAKFMCAIFILLQISMLNYCFMGLRSFVMPFKSCMNPKITRYYWQKITLVIGGIFFIMYLITTICVWAFSKSKFNTIIVDATETAQNVVIMYLNILQIIGSVYFGLSLKDSMLQLSKFQLSLAITNAFFLSLNNIWNNVLEYVQLFDESNSYSNQCDQEAIRIGAFGIGTIIQCVFILLIIMVMSKSMRQLKQFEDYGQENNTLDV